MGVMEKMRRSTGIILWVLIFSFGVLWMLQDTQVFSAIGAGPRSLGSVNGEPISNEEYQSRVTFYSNQYSQQSGNAANAEQRAYFQQQAWDELVTSKLLTQKMDELGITVTDQEVVNMITGPNPDPFIRQQFGREDGSIDRAALNQAINSEQNSQTWLAIEQQLRQKRRQQKMTNYVQSAMRISNNEVQQQYIRNNTTADVSFVRLPYSSIPEGEIEVTESEMRTYYNENSDQFQRDESYQFSYVSFDKTPTAQDTARTIKEIEELRTEFAETSDDSVFLARYQSSTPYKQEMVDKDEVRDLFMPVLNDLETGEVSDVIQDGGSVYTLKKLDETSEQVRFQVMSYTIQADPIATVDQRAEDADDFSFYASQDGFETEAERRELQIRQSSATKGNTFIPGLGQSRQIMSMLENADEGNISNTIELPNQFVVIKVNEITPAGTRPFEEVQQQISNTLFIQKRQEAAVEQMNSLLQNNNDLESLASAIGSQVQTADSLAMSDRTIPGAGREPKVVGAIFGLSEGAISSPIKGTNAVFVAQVANRSEADPANMTEEIAQQIHQELQKQKSSTFGQVWLAQLREAANIEDYRNQVLQQQ